MRTNTGTAYLFAQVKQKKRLKVKNYGQEAEDGGEKKIS
jgi:hypothetical protein